MGTPSSLRRWCRDSARTASSSKCACVIVSTARMDCEEIAARNPSRETAARASPFYHPRRVFGKIPQPPASRGRARPACPVKDRKAARQEGGVRWRQKFPPAADGHDTTDGGREGNPRPSPPQGLLSARPEDLSGGRRGPERECGGKGPGPSRHREVEGGDRFREGQGPAKEARGAGGVPRRRRGRPRARRRWSTSRCNAPSRAHGGSARRPRPSPTIFPEPCFLMFSAVPADRDCRQPLNGSTTVFTGARPEGAPSGRVPAFACRGSCARPPGTPARSRSGHR